jgi:hypothetical protein
MRFVRSAHFLISISFCLLSSGLIPIATMGLQLEPPPIASRNTQALGALRQAVLAMGGSAPVDSTATGSIVITAGGRTESGTYTLMTRGVSQSSERIVSPSTNETRIYSDGRAGLTVSD